MRRRYEQGNYGVDVTDGRHFEGAEASPAEEQPQMDHKEVLHLGPDMPRTDPCFHDDLFGLAEARSDHGRETADARCVLALLC